MKYGPGCYEKGGVKNLLLAGNIDSQVLEEQLRQISIGKAFCLGQDNQAGDLVPSHLSDCNFRLQPLGSGGTEPWGEESSPRSWVWFAFMMLKNSSVNA